MLLISLAVNLENRRKQTEEEQVEIEDRYGFDTLIP